MVFSTILKVKGNEILYNVYKNKRVAFLSPKYQFKTAPILFATLNNEQWVIKGTTDHFILEQAYKEIIDI